MFENTVLRKIFSPYSDEVNEPVPGDRRVAGTFPVYTPHQILFPFFKSRSVRGVGRVGRTGEKRNAYRLWWGKLRGRCHFQELSFDMKIILKIYLKN
jgi:hypothetical protein